MGGGLVKFALHHQYAPMGEECPKPSSQSSKSWLDDTCFKTPALLSPSNTVIVFDWDDTLLCSTAINRSAWTSDQLEELEGLVRDILGIAMRLGETHIVTNGSGTWVQESSEYFFPNLLPTLRQVNVMSARSRYEGLFPGDPFQWKRQAFKEVLARRCGPGDVAARGVNLVALGDSFAEIQAAEGATKVLSGPSLVKTVKFKELPSVTELLGQLRKTRQMLHKIVQLTHSVSRGLIRRPIPLRLDQLAGWATGWRISDRGPSQGLRNWVAALRF